MQDSQVNRDNIIDKYYQSYHNHLQHSGIQGIGQTVMNRKLESFWNSTRVAITLEVGIGNGQHLKFVEDFPTSVYIGIDKRWQNLDNSVYPKDVIVANIKGDVQDLIFPTESVDRVVSTCILHHLENPLSALLELRRVTKIGGEIAILMPTDPGIVNRTIKYFSVHARARKIGYNSKLTYALDHRNHISSLLEQMKYVFAKDELSINFFPFNFLKSWNVNLFVIIHVTKL